VGNRIVENEDGSTTIHFDPPIIMDVGGQEWTVATIKVDNEEVEDWL